MKLSCPKCNEDFETKKEISDAGVSETCSACQTRIWFQKESFILRAYKKTGSLHCSNCGSQIDAATICKKCGFLYPDYLIIGLTKEKVRKYKAGNLSFNFKEVKNKNKRKLVDTPYSFESGRGKKSIRPLYFALLSLIVIISGWIFYSQYKIKKTYMNNFVMALYGMKAGADRGLSVCEQGETDFTYKISKKDSDIAKEVNNEIEDILKKLHEPPDEFNAAGSQLLRLNGAYNSIFLYSLNTTGTLSTYCTEARKLEDAFQNSAVALKNSMPEDLAEAVALASLKYKKLKFIVD